MKLPITRDDDRLGDVADQVAASRGRRGGRALRPTISRIAGSCVGDPLRREASLEERLQAIVLGRVHADEHRLLQLQRDSIRGLGAAKPPISEE